VTIVELAEQVAAMADEHPDKPRLERLLEYMSHPSYCRFGYQ
jgi:hypothetical protein